MSAKGYISPSATLHHDQLKIGKHVFIGDRVLIYKDRKGGPVEIGDGVHIYGDTIIQTGYDGYLEIGKDTHIQPRCQFSAYMSGIRIGNGVQIAPFCAFYPYDHGIVASRLIMEQPLKTKGGIRIEDDVWLGVGVIVLDGVTVGRGAVVGAGSVVTKDISDGAIAVGVPSRAISIRR
jgi:acetyltransferase-like isoleucine patch superfamily enzyme